MTRLIRWLLITGLAVPLIATPAGTAVAAAPTIPLVVDSSALRYATIGPVVATGTITDARGNKSEGTVAALAWPNDQYNRTLQAGSAVPTPTVGWARTAKDGSFALRVDP